MVKLKLKNNTCEAGFLINESKYGFKIKTYCGALLFIPREEVIRIQINQSR